MATTKATELSQFSSTLTVDSSGNVVLTGSVTASSFLTGGTALLDSSRATALIDSAYVQARQVDLQRDSAFITGIADSAYVQARQDFAYSSLTGSPTALSSFTNDTNYLDSTTVQGVIDATYIQANQTTYDFLDSSEALNLIAAAGYTKYDSDNTTGMLTTYATQSYVTTQINNLIDGAPGTLDTLNEIAAALNDDDSAYNTLLSLINLKTDFDSSSAIGLIDSAYILARAPEPDGDGLAFAIALG